jgi:hypothetical protein
VKEMKYKILKNTFADETSFENLEEAKHYFTPKAEEIKDAEESGLYDMDDYREYINGIKNAESLEELAEILNSRTDEYSNGTEWRVEEY